jgi:hypothetical protein
MNAETPLNPDGLLETFAAELALEAYRVALRTKRQGTWLDLELDIWRALADKVKAWGQEYYLGAGCLRFPTITGPTSAPPPAGPPAPPSSC